MNDLQFEFVPLQDYKICEASKMLQNAADFYNEIRKRRTVRDFSSRPVPRAIIENCILAAGSAPSGANLQPWHFVVVQNQEIKSKIRIEAEKEECDFYHNKAPKEWLDALAPLGTDEHKSFLTTAPCLIVVFSKSYDILDGGKKVKNYYVKESVGIATGILLTALHLSGLVTLTHTPSPMSFLTKICKLPSNEKPYMIVVTGYPDIDAQVPVHGMKKKDLKEIASFL